MTKTKAKTKASRALKAEKKIERRIEKPLKAVEKRVAPQSKGAPKSAAAGKAIAETLGGLLPPPFNALASPILGKLGSFVGDKVGTFFGAGDYQTNSLIDMLKGDTNATKSMGVPYVHSQGGEVRLCFREDLGPIFAAPVLGDTIFYRYKVHACDPRTFPYLSQIAHLFQNWRPNGMIFQFESQTGPISDEPNLGVVSMAMEYDAGKINPFSSIQQMDNSYGGFARKTTEDLAFGVECALGKNVLDTLYCRNDLSAMDTHDPQFYDLGTFVIAAQGQPKVSQEIGRLWVSYDISLSKSLLERSLVGDPRMATWYFGNMNVEYPLGGKLFWDTDAYITDTVNNTIGATNFTNLSVECPSYLNPLDYVPGTILHFPSLTAGHYRLEIAMGLWTSNAVGQRPVPEVFAADRCQVGACAVTSAAGVTRLQVGGDVLNPNKVYTSPQDAVNSNLCTCSFTMVVTGAGPTISFFGIGASQVASWTWVSLFAIPPEFSELSSIPMLPAAELGSMLPYPRPDNITPEMPLVHQLDYAGRKIGLIERPRPKGRPLKTARAETAPSLSTLSTPPPVSDKGEVLLS